MQSTANEYQNNSDNENVYAYQYDRSASTYNKTVHGELFYFDPNTIATDEWKKLGLKEKTIHTIQNFLSKGGHFYKPDDLKKIYGLYPDEFERLFPYIQIENKNATAEKILAPRNQTAFQCCFHRGYQHF